MNEMFIKIFAVSESSSIETSPPKIVDFESASFHGDENDNNESKKKKRS